MFFLGNSVFLPGINNTATLTTDELVRQPVTRNTHSNSFPCALQSLETWINFSLAVFFAIEHCSAHTFPPHPRMAGWCNGQEVHTNYMLAPVTSPWRVSGCQTLECDSLSDMGPRILVQLYFRKICCLCKHNSEARQPTHKKASGLAYLLNTFLGNLKLVHGHRIIIIIFQE